MDLSTGYPNAYFSWFSGYPQLTLVFLPGHEIFGFFPEVPGYMHVLKLVDVDLSCQPDMENWLNPGEVSLWAFNSQELIAYDTR